MNFALFALKRNDIEGALRLRAEGLAAGTWTSADQHMILMLQDRTDELVARMNNEVAKALPRMSDEQRDEANAPVGPKASGASKKQAGASGKTRYTYPSEQQGSKGGGEGPSQSAQPQQGGGGGGMQEQEEALPHPDTPHPQPDQSPIAAEHPEEAPKDDPRTPHPQQAEQPKHTINLGELCAALNIQRSVLQQIVARMQKNFGEEARHKFMSFMQTQLKQFADEHGLEGDYFGLLFDVLTGKVQEGQPSSQKEEPVAKPAGNVR